MGRLEGKVVIVTGAARGQGACEARLFVQEGARVVLGDVLDDEGEAVASDLGESAVFLHMDIGREEDWRRAVEAARNFGSLDVLVNNAAVMHFGAIESTSLEDYRRVIEINQIGTFLGMRAAIAPMREAGGGSIINVSSIDGLQAKNGLVAYVASKWAIRGMTKVAALELGRFGIRVNSLHPGGVDTLMGNPLSSDEIDQFYADYPIPRCGQPIDIARMALFMASDECSYSTGSEFVADGGWNAGHIIKWLPGAG